MIRWLKHSLPCVVCACTYVHEHAKVVLTGFCYSSYHCVFFLIQSREEEPKTKWRQRKLAFQEP